MAGLLDLFSGRSSDIYGNGLLTPEQRGGLGNIGLLALAGKLGQLAGPSFSPVPDFGAALGQAAGAYGASQEGAGTAALNAILTGQKGRKLEQELDYYTKLGPILGKLAGDWPGADRGTAATPETGSTGGGAAAPLSAGGGGGGGGGGGVPAQYAELIRQAAAKENVDPAVLTSLIGHESSFRPDIRGTSGEVGLAQLMPGTAQSLGVTDRTDPTQSIFAAARYLRQGLDAHGGDYTMALRYYNGGPGGVNKPQTLTYANTVLGGAKRYGGTAAAPTAAAPDSVRVPYNYGAPSGGALNLPQVPNFSSRLGGAPQADVGETVAPADVLPNRVGRFAGVAPGTPVNSGGFPYNPEITDPAVAARVAQSMAAIKQAQQSGVPWAAPRETSGSSTDPIMSVTSADQAGGGDALGGMASGLLAPGGPLTRGVPGMPPMPPAAAPSADPSLQLGPLAPAPAAAAPAAPGPGLLSPGALPGTAAALPRGANPAYDAWLRNAAAAAGLVKGAGLPDAIGPLIEAFTKSPSYQAELERAKARIGVEFAGPKAEAEKAVELRYSEALAAAAARGNLPSQIILKTVEAQNQFKNSMAPLGLQATFDKDGNASVSDLPGFKENAPAAAGAVESAKPTPEMKNYDAYVKDAQMRNQPVLSRYDWERTKGSPDPDKAARIALDLKVAEPLAAQAAAGVQAKPLLDEVVRLAYQTPEGMAGEGSAAAGKLMAAFGFAPTDRMSNAELLTGLQQRLIGPIREPGTSSDRDVSRYLLATPGLMSTGDGRVKMAEMTKALIDRNNELAQVYRNNLGSPDLQSKLAIIHNKPLFSDEQRAAIDETIRTRGGTVPGGVMPGERVPAATAPPASAAPPGGRQIGTFQGKPVFEMPDGSRKVMQ